MSRLDEIKARHQLRCHESGCECLDALAAEVARLTAERDALAAQVAQVESLADHWARRAASDYEAGGTLTWGAADVHFSAVLRDALAGSIGQEAAPDAGHKCEPYYSRAECGRCGWQEQWCVTCSRQMCRCATDATDQDAMGADQ